MSWFVKASEQRHKVAEYTVGMLFHNENGCLGPCHRNWMVQEGGLRNATKYHVYLVQYDRECLSKKVNKTERTFFKAEGISC